MQSSRQFHRKLLTTSDIRYVIIKASLIDKLDFSKLLSNKDTLRYNTNKFFLQPKKTFIKFKGKTPEELENKKQYTADQIKKKMNASWGQWYIKSKN